MIPAFLLPLIAVAADSAFITITKRFFRRYGQLTSREFNWLQFAGIVFVLLLVIPFFGQMPTAGQLSNTWLLILILVVLAVSANLLYFWGLEHEKISEIEPFLLFNPLGAILVVGLFYPDERNWMIWVAVVLASIVLGWAHIKQHRFAFTRGLWAIIAFIGVYALHVSVIKTLLVTYDPVTLYFMRSMLVLVGLTIVAMPKFRLIKAHHLAPFGILGGLAVASVVAAYTAYQIRGVSETVFVFVLSPILVYILSVIFLNEKWKFKNVVASIIITALVILISLIK